MEWFQCRLSSNAFSSICQTVKHMGSHTQSHTHTHTHTHDHKVQIFGSTLPGWLMNLGDFFRLSSNATARRFLVYADIFLKTLPIPLTLNKGAETFSNKFLNSICLPWRSTIWLDCKCYLHNAVVSAVYIWGCNLKHICIQTWQERNQSQVEPLCPVVGLEVVEMQTDDLEGSVHGTISHTRLEVRVLWNDKERAFHHSTVDTSGWTLGGSGMRDETVAICTRVSVAPVFLPDSRRWSHQIASGNKVSMMGWRASQGIWYERSTRELRQLTQELSGAFAELKSQDVLPPPSAESSLPFRPPWALSGIHPHFPQHCLLPVD